MHASRWILSSLFSALLILDQFEEIFTLQSEVFRLAAAGELGELVSRRLPDRLRRRRGRDVDGPTHRSFARLESNGRPCHMVGIRVANTLLEDGILAWVKKPPNSDVQELPCDPYRDKRAQPVVIDICHI